VDIEEFRDEIRHRIHALAIESDVVLIPLGVSHPDHVIVAAEALMACERHGALYVYEDLPYRVQFPDQVAATLASRLNDEWIMECVDPFARSIIEIKTAAVECYRSQLSPEMRRWCLVPERLWRTRRA
jgi:LmbE family N-acetylglucosaminyl deacetylase